MGPPTWKTKDPPCDAHLILSKMFEDNKIPANIAPAAAQKLHPEFQRYSAQVFANHFKELKGKWGLARELIAFIFLAELFSNQYLFIF